MKALILCDRDSVDFNGDDICKNLQDAIANTGCEVSAIKVNFDELNPCMGCFNCWTKTPGLCIFTDDKANSIACDAINTDILIVLSKVIYGGFSADIKAYLDRSIQNISPYFEIINSEMHHKKRYDRYPDWVAFGYGDISEDERQTFNELSERNALNMHAKRHISLTAKDESELAKSLGKLIDFISAEVNA